MKETVMENYIYLCWAQLWAMTFWYHDPEEKRYRFNQLLNVLDRLGQYEIEIFNLLFESINKYGDESMIIELYNKMLLKYKLYPTYSICTIYNKIIDKKNLQKNQIGNIKSKDLGGSSNKNIANRNSASSLNKNLLNSSEIIKLNTTNISTNISRIKNPNIKNTNENLITLIDLEKQQFRVRSIKSKFDESDISDKYIFLDVYPCVECQYPIDLYSICRNFKDMNKELEWALCMNCQTKILPKLRVKYLEKKEFNSNQGVQMRRNSFGSYSDLYNCDETEVLYSPFHLKYNFYYSSFIESRLKLDIDNFKIKFNALFWNSVWYFKIKDLPYDFISPYIELSTESLKLMRNENQNTPLINSLDSINKFISYKNVNYFIKNSSNNIDKNLSSSSNLNNTLKIINNFDNNEFTNLERQTVSQLDIKKHEDYKNHAIANYSEQNIHNIYSSGDKNNELNDGTEDGKDNFSSLKTFENIVLSTSSDNLENELNKINNYSSNNKNESNSKILKANFTNSNIGNPENYKIFENDDDEYKNLIYRASENNDIYKNSGFDGQSAKISFQKNNNNVEQDLYLKVKKLETEKYDYKRNLSGTPNIFNISDYNVNIPNRSNPNVFLNLKYESLTKSVNRVNINNNEEVVPRIINSYNLNTSQHNSSLEKEKINNRTSEDIKILNQNKFTNNKHLNKDISSKINSDSEAIFHHSSNEIYNPDNLKISNQIKAAYPLIVNHENHFNNSVNQKSFFNYQNFNSIANELNRNTSDENLIDKNEEKINISSHKIENIEIKSFDKEKHVYKKSEILMNPLELDKLKLFNTYNSKTETLQINQKNHIDISVNKKINLNLYLDKSNDEDFSQKFKNNNSLITPSNNSNGCIKLRLSSEKNYKEIKNKSFGSYYQTSRIAQDKKNFGDILVNLEREKLEFEKNFESNTDLESLKKNNNTKSTNNSTKELKKVQLASFKDHLNTKESEYFCFNEIIDIQNKNEKSFNFNKLNSNTNPPQNNTFLNIQNYPSPIPCDEHNLINYDALSFIEKNDNLYNREFALDNQKSNLNSRKNQINSIDIKNSNICIERNQDTINLTTNNEFQLAYSSRTRIVDKKYSENLNNTLKQVNFNLNNSDPKVENFGCHSARDQQNNYNISSLKRLEITNPNTKSNENVVREAYSFREKNCSSYSEQRLILSQDDLINNQSYMINENFQRIKPNYESKKSSYCRLGTILEVIETEKEKDRVFFNSHSSQNFDSENLNCENAKKITFEKDSNNSLSFYNFNLGKQTSSENTIKELNENLGQTIINDKKNMGKYISLNIREIIKDKEKIEKTNLRSRCNTEELELDSPRGIYDNHNISKQLYKSESVKGALIINEKNNTKLISDRDKTPIKFINEGIFATNNNTRQFESIKEFISTSVIDKNTKSEYFQIKEK